MGKVGGFSPIFRRELQIVSNSPKSLLIIILVAPIISILLPAIGLKVFSSSQTARVGIAGDIHSLINESSQYNLVRVADPRLAVERGEVDLAFELGQPASIYYTPSSRSELADFQELLELAVVVDGESVKLKFVSIESTDRSPIGISISFIILFAMFPAIGAVIESITTERQLRSIEILLALPIGRRALLLGKVLVGLLIACASAVSLLLILAVVAAFAPSIAALGLSALTNYLWAVCVSLFVVVPSILVLQMMFALTVRSPSSVGGVASISLAIVFAINLFSQALVLEYPILALFPVIGAIHSVQWAAIGEPVNWIGLASTTIATFVLFEKNVELVDKDLPHNVA